MLLNSVILVYLSPSVGLFVFIFLSVLICYVIMSSSYVLFEIVLSFCYSLFFSPSKFYPYDNLWRYFAPEPSPKSTGRRVVMFFWIIIMTMYAAHFTLDKCIMCHVHGSLQLHSHTCTHMRKSFFIQPSLPVLFPSHDFYMHGGINCGPVGFLSSVA